MTHHPIYLPPARIPAFLDGRMTHYAEPLKVQPDRDRHVIANHTGDENRVLFRGVDCGYCISVPLPHAVGDQLWLAEDFCEWRGRHQDVQYRQAIGESEWANLLHDLNEGAPWIFRSARAMPKWASRAWAEVKSVVVKRVQEITEAEARAEGVRYTESIVHPVHDITCLMRFRDRWNATHGPDAWSRNDWCTMTTWEVHLGSLEDMRLQASDFGMGVLEVNDINAMMNPYEKKRK